MELFRIIVMLFIVAHHYVVNSGLIEIMKQNPICGHSIFLYLFGMWGKTGINCFIMITGYFMCKSEITFRKFLKLFLEVEFYSIAIYLLFCISGYEHFSFYNFILSLMPIHDVSHGFTSCFLLFYLCIPFLNILIRNMNQREHAKLILLELFIYMVLGMIPIIEISMNYISWFSVVYLIASYIRIYKIPHDEDMKYWGKWSVIFIIVSMLSVLALLFVSTIVRKPMSYFFVSDSNAILAVCTSVCLFMFFKNLKLQSKMINIIASSTFAVLLIHANSDTMRTWLWHDVLHNTEYFFSEWYAVHAICSVIFIFIICIVIDRIRIYIIEKPIFHWIDNIFYRHHLWYKRYF